MKLAVIDLINACIRMRDAYMRATSAGVSVAELHPALVRANYAYSRFDTADAVRVVTEATVEMQWRTFAAELCDVAQILMCAADEVRRHQPLGTEWPARLREVAEELEASAQRLAAIADAMRKEGAQ